MASSLPPGPATGAESGGRGWVAPLVVAAVAVAAYANTLTLGFTLDDFPLVVDNPRIGDPAWLASLVTDGRMWRPLKRLSLALDAWLWGTGRPAGFHATNVALHAAACVALWAVAVRIGLRRGAALVAALLFALHPVHVEAVANVAHRKEPMALLFSLLAFLAYLRGRTRRAPAALSGWAAVSAGAYLLAMSSKEVAAVMLPGAIVAYELLVPRDPPRAKAARLAAFLPALGLVVLLFTVRGYIGTLDRRFEAEQIRWVTQDRSSSYGTMALVAAKAFGENARLLVWPWPLYFDRQFGLPRSPAEPGVIAGLLALGAFAAAIAGSARRAPLACFALAWYGLNLLPVSNVVPLSYWPVAERFLYGPSAGIALLAGIAWGAARGRAATAIALVTLGACAAATVTQNRVWKDGESLYAHTLVHNPESFRALHGMGLVLEAKGDRAGAEDRYRAAIRSSPSYAEARYALAVLLLEDGRIDEARTEAVAAAGLAPKDPRPYSVIGNAEMARERWPEAAAAYRAAVERDRDDPDALYNLGNALAAAGERDEALRALDRAVALGGGAEAEELREEIRARPAR